MFYNKTETVEIKWKQWLTLFLVTAKINIGGENCSICHHPSFSAVSCDLSTCLLQSTDLDFLQHKDKQSP